VSSDEGGIRGRAMKLLGRDEAEDERLLNLFRNRAELKQAFADLQSHLHRAEERLASQEAATRRAEERLRSVEDLLARPGSGYKAMAYFQLRALWRESRERLQALADQLRGLHEDRMRRESLMRFNQDKQRQLAALDGEISEARRELSEKRGARAAVEIELAAAKGLFGLFSRRRLARELEARQGDVEAVKQRLSARLDRRAAVDSARWPEFEGIDVAAKREINLAIIALAQELYLHFSANDLAKRAREAAIGTVQEVDYGSEHECKALIARIHEAREVPPDRAGWGPPAQARARVLAAEAKFRSDRETVPMASSMGRIDVPMKGEARRIPLEVNVLTEEYWDLYETFVP
jgi:DNA repair exonuclease SbcCD ATPase subunit